jgi:O-antigen/teichoic acid export membrane protein
MLGTGRKEIDSGQASALRRPSLIVNAVSNWAALGVNIAVGFFLTPFIIHYLGKTGYGIWTLIGSLLGYYGLLNLGVDSAITRYVARYAAQDNEKALNETVSTAMVMFCCTGALTIGASFLLAAPLARFFRVAPEHFYDFKHAFWVLGLAIGLSFAGNIFTAVIRAHERYVAANCAQIAQTLVRAGFVASLLPLGKGLRGVAYAMLIAVLFGNTAMFFLCRRLTPWVQINLRTAKWPALRRLLVYSGITTVIVVADLMRFNLDSFVIGKWVGMAEVGVYGIAALLVQYMLRLVGTGMGVLKPRFAALDGAKEHRKLQSLFLRSLSVSAVLGFGASMLGIVFGGRFILLWVGDEFTEAIPVLWILATAYAFALSQAPGIGLMYALNKHHLYAIATIIEGIANVILSITLASNYGIIGVALGTAIPMLVVKIIVQPVYVSKIIDIGLLDYAKTIVVPAVIALAMSVIAYGVGVMRDWEELSVGNLIVVFLLVGLAYIGAVLCVSRCLGFTDVAIVFNRVRGILR